MVFLKVLVFRVRLWFIKNVLKMKLSKMNLLKTKALTQNYSIFKTLRIDIINLFHTSAYK